MRLGVAIAAVAVLLMGCGAQSGSETAAPDASVEAQPNYCVGVEEDDPYCDEQGQMTLDWATDRAIHAPELPAGVFPSQIEVHDVAPDGTHLGNAGQWHFWFALGLEEFKEVVVFPQRIEVRDFVALDAACGIEDEVDGEQLQDRVRQATAMVEQTAGLVFEPGVYQLNASEIAPCLSSTGSAMTLVNFAVGDGAGYTVEFSSEYPDGTVCALAAEGCTDQ
jgi:hypothetical protein